MKTLKLSLIFNMVWTLGAYVSGGLSLAEAQAVGREAAQKYFVADSELKEPSTNLLMIHYGQFVNSDAYSWADQSPVDGAGLSTVGVTYGLDRWSGFDVNIRVDIMNYNVGGTAAQQLAVMPLITFPRSQSKFPIYFGVGAGPGIFTQQLTNKSALALDYELLVGARFTDLYQGVGTFIEGAMKNDFFALSTGQFIGTALEFGLVFSL
jgi:hypothetical protein